jgi:hypothetical protein
MAKYDRADLERRMKGAVEALKHDLSGLRTGRANVGLLDPVHVEVYGQSMPLNQVATVTAPEPRLLSVQVGDPLGRAWAQSDQRRSAAAPADPRPDRGTAQGSCQVDPSIC